MSYKKTSLLFLTVIALAGVFFYIRAMSFPGAVQGQITPSGPVFYPQLLSALMVFLSVGGIASTLRKKEDKRLEIPNIGRYVFMLTIICAWVLLWEAYGNFYLIAFFCNGIILYVLNSEPNSTKKAFKILVIDTIIMVLFYIIFKLLMKVPL